MIPIALVLPLEKQPLDAHVPQGVTLLCPFCKDSFLHIGGVSYAGVKYEPRGVRISGKTLQLDSPVPATGRGDRVYLEFWGECGHRFGLLIQHHKGETFLYRVDPSGANAGEVGSSEAA